MRQIALALILFTTPLSAAVFHQIDTTTPLCCSLSSNHHNRILVEGSRIKKLIFPEDKLYVRMEETSGQVFVQTKHFSQENVVVSVITKEGLVQDIELTFSESPPQVIILKDSNPEEKPMLSTVDYTLCPSTESEDIQTTIDAILQGSTPSGYITAPVINSTCTVKPGITAKIVGRFQSWHHDLYIYQVKNTRPWRKRLHEKSFSHPKTLWAYLAKHCLKPNENTLAIVAVRP